MRFPARSFDPQVALGLATLGALLWTAWRVRLRAPLVTLGVGWFLVAVLPVSHLVVRAGVLLAERTLYVPSVGFAWVVAGVGSLVLARGRTAARVFAGVAAVAVAGFLARSVARNPTWLSTFTVLETLGAEHPESHLAVRARATGLERAGYPGEAARYYDTALELAPASYSLLVEVADFHGRHGNFARAEELLRRAIEVLPDQPQAWRLWAGNLLLQRRGREAHRVALEGLRLVGADRELWDLVSESYILKGDFAAAARARRAALALDPRNAAEWRRLAEILEAGGDTAAARAARERAEALR
ncbi:MAG: tetratricopeptide repeat protein [Gemmatimonadetes bacterium]|nr:MAG: tetratricopeptide repeat protein [Gemmatimonadota bacterium]